MRELHWLILHSLANVVRSAERCCQPTVSRVSAGIGAAQARSGAEVGDVIGPLVAIEVAEPVVALGVVVPARRELPTLRRCVV